MKILCPFCDSGNVEKVEIEERFPVPFCEDAVVKHQIYRCNDCEEEGDFSGTTDKTLAKAITEANVASAPELLDALARSGITMSSLLWLSSR